MHRNMRTAMLFLLLLAAALLWYFLDSQKTSNLFPDTKSFSLLPEFAKMSRDELAAHLRTESPIPVPVQGESEDPVAEADLILSGRIKLPSHPETDFPLDPTWREDPFEDPNWRFQLHSFRWPICLLYAWQRTADHKYLDHLNYLVQDYARDCLDVADPPDMTWYDMGASLRLENWLGLRRALLLSGDLDDGQHLQFLKWTYQHGAKLADDVKYNPTGNHGMFHNRSLVCAGLSFPQLARAEEWLNLGRRRASEQIVDLVSENGVYLENAPTYHFMMLKVFNSMEDLLNSGGQSLPDEGLERLKRMPAFMAHLIKPDGTLPMIGNSPSSLKFASYKKLSPELDFAISGGSEGVRPGTRYVCYPDEGYLICRSGWGESRDFAQETFLFMDLGPKGGWHGHYDAMNVLLSAYGADLLVDSGYYSFKGEPLRHRLQQPEAHNVVTPIERGKREDSTAESKSILSTAGEGFVFQAAESEPDKNMTWRRYVIYLEPDDVIIIDKIDDAPDKGWRQNFHLHPGARAKVERGVLEVRNGTAYMELATGRGDDMPVLHTSTEDTVMSWYSAEYGRKEPSSLVTIDHAPESNWQAVLLHVHDGGNGLQSFRDSSVDGDRYNFIIDTPGGSEAVTINSVDGTVVRERLK